MRFLLFGGSGQLGYEVEKRAADLNFETISPVISEVDISDFEQVSYLTKKVRPDLIVNCAAYTNVDKAEEERDLAYAINATGAGNTARAAAEVGCRLIHISTDFVFDGSERKPISEDADPRPLSTYGASKLAGERAVLEHLPQRALILRTSSLHGQKGNNFVHIMLKLFAEREVVRVVGDRYMSPTWAGWLAEVILDLGRMDCHGILHASCDGAITWYDFAAEILELVRAKLSGAERVKLERISSEEYVQPAKRPDYSVFDCTRLTNILGRKPISWKEGLRSHISEMKLG